MVLGMLLVVVTLANAILTIISSQSRFTHHQVSRIQAYYAAMAGVNYTFEMLRTAAWVYDPLIGANSCPSPAGCLFNDPTFPASIVGQQFRVVFCPIGAICPPLTVACIPPPGINFCVDVTTTYTYTP